MRRLLLSSLLLVFLLPVAARARAQAPSRIAAPSGPAARVEPLPTDTPAWQLAWGRLDARHPDVGADTSYSGALTVQRLGGERLWGADLGAFAYALRLCDLDRDGRAEVVTASARGEVRVYDSEGALRWQVRPGGHPLSLACGSLLARDATHLAVGTTHGEIVLFAADGREARRIPFPFRWRQPPAVRFLDAADTTGDGLDELLFANYERVYGVVDPRSARALWQRETHDRDRWILSAAFVDFDGDGRPEAAVSGKHAVVAADAAAERFERPIGRVTLGFRMGHLAAVDLDGDGRQELAVQNGPELTVYDGAGGIRYQANAAQYYFTTMTSPPAPGREVLLGSVAGPDQNLYRVRFGGAERDQLQALRDPPGPRAAILQRLLALREQALAAPADPQARSRRFYVNLEGNASDPRRMRSWLGEQQAFRKAYPYENLVFHHGVTFAVRGRHARPLAEMLALAEQMEREGFLHVVTVGHSLDGNNDVAAVEQWLAKAPKTCLGVRVSELAIESGLSDAAAGRRTASVRSEVGRFYGPLLDLATRRGLHAELLMKRNFWILAPASRQFREELFAPGRRAAILATEEGSYTRAPENSLMARMGLWHAGLIGAWGQRVIDDDLRLDRFYDHQGTDTSHVLRSLVAAAAGGATHFAVKPRYLLRDLRGLGAHELAPGAVLNDDGLASLDLFLHLLGKGLLDVPTRESIASLSPVALRFVEPGPAFVRESERRNLPDDEAARAVGLFTGVSAGRVPAPPSYLAAAVLGVRSFGLAFYPENPFGLPAIVPDWAPPSDAALRTDGDRVQLDGNWTSGAAATERVAGIFRQAAERLPVRAEGAHWMATRRSGDVVRVTLVDPDYLEPRARSVRIVASRPIRALRDVLGRTELPHEPGAASVSLDAGAIRILDVQLGESAAVVGSAPR